MPVEVLTREEIERLIEEKVKRLLAEAAPVSQAEAEIQGEIAKISAQISEMKSRIESLSAKPPAKTVPAPSMEDALRGELGGLSELLEIRSQPDQVTLRPKRWLGTQNFRSVSEVVRRHGGFWSSVNRTFIIRRIKG